MVLKMIAALLSLSFLWSVLGGNVPTKVLNRDYTVWCQGNCDVDAQPASTSGGVVLMGGGTDTDEAFVWQIQNAAKGDFVVLRASGDDAYNPYIYNLSVVAGSKLNSVTTILLNNRKASAEEEVLKILRNAEAIFFAGGDQSDYLDFWVGTDIQTIVQNKLEANVTIGGTSAGCAILGNWVYTGEKGSTVSDEALTDPYNRLITITDAFLHIPFLESVITDTHFVTRDRMGRMLTFSARILKDIDTKPPSISRSVGVDEHTALLLNIQTGDVQAVGQGTAYVCQSNHPAQICKKDTPLTFQDVHCTRLSAKTQDRFSFATWKGIEGSGAVDYTSNIVAGKFTNVPYGPV